MSPIIYTPHDCEKPGGDMPAGTLYQCPECDRVWERGTDVFEDDTNLHWWVEEDPRRAAILREACTQNNPHTTHTVTPDMVKLALDTYAEHEDFVTRDGREFCAECDAPLTVGPLVLVAHASQMAAAALQDALRGETRE